MVFGFTPTGTAGVDDSIYITGVAIKPTGAASPFDFPPYDQDLYDCQTRCVVASVYVPATTAQNLLTLHLRATPTITGAGSGFSSTGTTRNNLIAYQTSGAVVTLTLSADL